MNLNSDNRQSLETLKRRNDLPPEAPEPHSVGTSTHPTAEEWQELHRMLWAMGEVLGTQTVILEELSGRLPPLAGLNTMGSDAAICRGLLDRMGRDTETIRKLLEEERQRREQAGRKNGRRFLPCWPSVPLAPFEPGWLFLPLGLALLLGLLLISARLWSGINVLFM